MTVLEAAGLGAGALLERASAVLAHVPEGEGEVSATAADASLTRFASNAIHQSVAETHLTLRLRVVHQGRVGVATIRGDLEDAPRRLAAAAERARRVAPAGEPTPPPARPAGERLGAPAHSVATADATPERRSDGVAIVADAARAHGFAAYGAFSTTEVARAIVNTSGLRRRASTTCSSLTAVVRGPDGSGYAARHHSDVDLVDVGGLAAEVVGTCGRNQRAEKVAPGDYEVVLAPYAVATLLEHLSWAGFSALAQQEHRSFMRPGELLMSPGVTIRDDALDAAGSPFPFDDEGVATNPVILVEDGVCARFVHDSATGRRAGVASTGHALPMPNSSGPLARHLMMDGGDRVLDELIAGTRRGLFVTRLWYVRQIHSLRTIITGMTRDGTFLIEDGKLVGAVRDLRFTQSIVDALADVRGITRERRLERSESEAAVLAPWLHLGHFAFTS